MSALQCGAVRTLAPELALGVLDGVERAETLAHVESCARCQALVAELTEAVDLMPLLVPEREPPFGFERRVLQSIVPAPRRGARILRMAAVAAAVATLVVGIEAIVGGSPSSEPGAGSAQVATPVAVQMFGTASDAPAGWVYITAGRSIAMTLDYAVSPGHYRLEAIPPTGNASTLADITVVGGATTAWTGSSPVRLRSGSTLGLVDADGVMVCRARIA